MKVFRGSEEVTAPQGSSIARVPEKYEGGIMKRFSKDVDSS